MKKYIFAIIIYLVGIGLIPTFVKYRTNRQHDLLIQGFYETYYYYFDIYEFVLRQFLDNEISDEAFERLLIESSKGNYDILVLTPDGTVFNDTDRFSNLISQSALDKIIVRTLQNFLTYFSEGFTENNSHYILSSKKMDYNNERWFLAIITDVSSFHEEWREMSKVIMVVYSMIWTIGFLLVVYLYYKKAWFLNQKKASDEVRNFVANISKNDEKLMFIFINDDAEIEIVSPQLLSLLEFNADYLIGTNINNLINDFNLSKLIKSSITKEQNNNEITIQDKHGVKFIFLMTFIPFYRSSSELSNILIFLNDITLMKSSINRLDFEVKKNMSLSAIAQLVMSIREPQLITKMIIDESRNLIEFDYGTTFLLQDDTLTPFYTDNPDFISKVGNFSIKIGEGLTGTVAKTGKAQIANDTFNNPITMQIPGTPVTHNECIMSAPLINSEGKMLGVMTYSRESLYHFTDMDLQLLEVLAVLAANIFDKTELLRKIEEEKEKHETLINESALAFLVIYDKKIIFCNRKFSELIKYETNELIGSDIFDFISLKDRSFFISQLTTFTLVGKTEIFEYEFFTSDKKSIILEFSLSSIIWDGRTSILASASDVTERIELNKRMLQTQKLESIGTLTSGIAHDFKNILTGIVGAVELILLKAEEGSSIKNMAKAIKLSADRAVKLSQRLLGYSRKVEDEIDIFDVNSLMRETLEIVTFTFDKNIEIKLDISSEPLFFEGDSVKIQQCIMNLCVNARDVMPNGGTLSIKTSLLKDFVYTKQIWAQAENINYSFIEITDTGPGIPDHLQEILFEPFFTTKSKGKGTGLGLSTTKTIITDYKGNISVKSKLGVGSSFRILLPWIAQEKEQDDDISHKVHTKTHSILLVDDEEIILDIAKDLLEELGNKVFAVNNGYDALDLIEQNPKITLAIIDRMMPKMDGLTLLKLLKRKKPELIVIVASGFLQDDVIQEFLDNGAEQCIAKPYTLDQLSRILKDM